MNDPELFVAGIVVTIIVAGAIALIVYGAILDGRNEQARDTGVPVYPGTDPTSPAPPGAADEVDGGPGVTRASLAERPGAAGDERAHRGGTGRGA